MRNIVDTGSLAAVSAADNADSSNASVPLRTCIATRQKLPQSHLLRLVLDPHDPTHVVADPARSIPGRGAWITPTESALNQAIQRKALRRAFKVSTDVDAGQVRKYIQSLSANDPETKRKTEH